MKTKYLLSNSFRLQLYFMPLYVLLTIFMNYLLSASSSLVWQLILLLLMFFFFNVLVLVYQFTVKVEKKWMKVLSMLVSTVICILLTNTVLFLIMPESRAFQGIDGERTLTWRAVLQVFNNYLGVLILAGFVYYHILSKFQLEQRIKEREEAHQRELLYQDQLHQKEMENKDLEIAFLSAQINPHFLHNTLSSMADDSDRYNPEVAQQLWNLSDLMRYKLECTENGNHIMPEIAEMIALRAYLSIMQWRFPNLTIQLETIGDEGQHRILPTILLALAENIFKHGRFRNGDFPVLIQRELHKEYIQYRMRNKIDPQSARKPSSGVGLKNIIRRLEILFPDKYQLVCQADEEGFFNVFLRINQE